MSNRNRLFCFTLHGFTDPLDTFHIDGSSFFCVQKEQVNGNDPHLQGVCYFKNARSFASVRRLIPGAHIEICRGTIEENIAYCSKEETRIEGPRFFLKKSDYPMAYEPEAPRWRRTSVALENFFERPQPVEVVEDPIEN